MIKIGIDVHGVIDIKPHFFSELSQVLVQNGHEVHILTGAERTEELEKYLRDTLRLTWTHFFSVTSHHKEAGTQITYINGNPYMDNRIWNRAKAEYCRRNRVQLHIDDSEVYGKYFGTSYAQFHNTGSEFNPEDLMPEEPAPDAKDETVEEDLKDDLSNYDENRWKKPSVTVDVAICTIMDDDLKVLLIKRKFPPYRNCWALPGGFLDIDLKESLEEAAARELEEETGLMNMYIEQLRTYGDVDRDPRTRVITTAYFTLVSSAALSRQNIRSASDAKDAQWFSLNNYNSELNRKKENLAFDHDLILTDLKKRLQEKIAITPIAFALLPEAFTWTELRKVYETILNRKIDPYGFENKIRARYEIRELEQKKDGAGTGKLSPLLNYDGEKEDCF